MSHLLSKFIFRQLQVTYSLASINVCRLAREFRTILILLMFVQIVTAELEFFKTDFLKLWLILVVLMEIAVSAFVMLLHGDVFHCF